MPLVAVCPDRDKFGEVPGTGIWGTVGESGGGGGSGGSVSWREILPCKFQSSSCHCPVLKTTFIGYNSSQTRPGGRFTSAYAHHRYNAARNAYHLRHRKGCALANDKVTDAVRPLLERCCAVAAWMTFAWAQFRWVAWCGACLNHRRDISNVDKRAISNVDKRVHRRHANRYDVHRCVPVVVPFLHLCLTQL
jgi:hypothetical protein